jgi:hypothetical protein
MTLGAKSFTTPPRKSGRALRLKSGGGAGHAEPIAAIDLEHSLRRCTYQPDPQKPQQIDKSHKADTSRNSKELSKIPNKNSEKYRQKSF